MSEFQLVKAITPKRSGLVDINLLNQKLNTLLRSYETKGKELLKRPTRTWTHKPQFSTMRTVSAKEVSIVVFASGENADKYRWINNGVRSHIIRAKNNKRMIFKVGYHASTVPNTLSSRTAKRSDPVAGANKVRHKITARRFTRTAAIELRRTFGRDVGRVIKETIKASR